MEINTPLWGKYRHFLDEFMKQKHQMQKLKMQSIIMGGVSTLIIFSAFGIITVLLPNDLFIRMTPVYTYDYIFLILTSILSGAYMGLWYYTKELGIGSKF